MRPVLLSLVAGCVPDPLPELPRGEAELVDVGAWEEGGASGSPDPLASHRPPDGDCPPGGVRLEGSSLEIQSGICTYAWFEQPALTDLQRGDPIELIFWHSVLLAEDPAEAHLAILVDGQPLYERAIPIPSDATAYNESFSSRLSSDPGALVTLHLHNHGANTWNLLRLERTAE